MTSNFFRFKDTYFCFGNGFFLSLVHGRSMLALIIFFIIKCVCYIAAHSPFLRGSPFEVMIFIALGFIT